MALFSVVQSDRLDKGAVLAPERYDPRRRVSHSGELLGDCAMLSKGVVNVAKASTKLRYLVLDTGDAREGIILTSKKPVNGIEIGSTKKLVQAGDVIISRLRPYLRQIAYVDSQLEAAFDDVQIACSTEFYVLRSLSTSSVAFLVPLLLSEQIQEILRASQEGGHHPRFGHESLMTLPVPEWLSSERERVSSEVIQAVDSARKSERAILHLVQRCNQSSS